MSSFEKKVKKEAYMMETNQNLHVGVKHDFDLNKLPEIHDFDLNKLPETKEGVDMAEIDQAADLENLNVKNKFDLNKIPDDGATPYPEYNEAIEEMLRILLPAYFKI